MTVDAGGDSMMAGLLPRIELRLHDMTIHTGSGVGAEIGKSLGVSERKRTDTGQNAHEDGDPGQLDRQPGERTSGWLELRFVR